MTFFKLFYKLIFFFLYFIIAFSSEGPSSRIGRGGLGKSTYYSFTLRVLSSMFRNETHFMSFAAIVATGNGTEGSNCHV